MTVPITLSRSTYTGNGATTVFSTGWYFLAASEVVVKLTPSGGSETVQTLGVHYTVAMPATVGGNGSITMLVAPPASSSLVVERTVPYTQVTSFRTQGNFTPAVHEDTMDELEFQIQQLARRISDLESAGAPGSVVAGNGLGFSGSTLHVGAGAGVQANADTLEVLFGNTTTSVAHVSAAAGTNATASRSDHQHDVSSGVPVAGAVVAGGTAAAGTATTVALSDHIHEVLTAAPVNVTKATAAVGTATTLARSDHKHDITTAAAVAVTDATNGEGAATSLARSDHTHAHGDRAGGTLHAVATTSVNGFMSLTDKIKLDALPPAGSSVAYSSTVLMKTTNATPQTIMTWQPAVRTCEAVEVVVAAKKDNLGAGAAYGKAFCTMVYDTVLVQIGTTQSIWPDIETAAGWDVTVQISGSNVNVQVTGEAASDIYWTAHARRIITSSPTQ